MVGRPREFDPDKVLDAAMHAFWAKGYEGTSLADLMAATGLHKGSLYQAFGDKHSLFIKSLQRYLDEMRGELSQMAAGALSPLEALRAIAHTAVDKVDADSECPMGCMAINSLVETAPHDKEVLDILKAHMEFMTHRISETVQAAQQAGQMSNRLAPDVVTAIMTTFIAGLGAELKGPMTKAQAHELLDVQFEALI